MATYKTYVEYFENLVSQNTTLDHDPANNKVAFFKINIEEVLTGIKQKIQAQNLFFVLTNYVWKPEAEGKNIKTGEGMFFILGTTEHGNYDKDTDILDDCEILTEKFIKRMNLDSKKESNDANAIWFGMQDTLKIQNVVPVLFEQGNQHIGYQVTFEFAAHLNMCVDLSDWDDLTTADDVNPNI